MAGHVGSVPAPVTETPEPPGAGLRGAFGPFTAYVVGVLLLACGVGAALLLALPGQLGDLDVYRAGGLATLHGLDPYRVVSGPSSLPFTYPPFAALLSAPLGALPRWVGALLLFAGDAAALWLVTARWLRPHLATLGRHPALLVCAIALLAEPVRSTLAYGQVNLLLLGLVSYDLVLRPRSRLAGIPTGLAAAVKLTPLIFLGWLVVTGQFKTAARACAAFVGAAGVAALVAPGPSRAYWVTYVRDPTRVGSAAYGSNQALTGLVARATGTAVPRDVPTVAATLVIALLGLLIAARWYRKDRGLSLCLVALTGLVISPISWSHHWVWLVPTIALLAVRHERLLRACAAVLALVTLVGVPSWYARNPLQGAVGGVFQLALSSSYLLAALFTLTVAGVLLRRQGPPDPR